MAVAPPIYAEEGQDVRRGVGPSIQPMQLSSRQGAVSSTDGHALLRDDTHIFFR